jgi:hypothetical protein
LTFPQLKTDIVTKIEEEIDDGEGITAYLISLDFLVIIEDYMYGIMCPAVPIRQRRPEGLGWLFFYNDTPGSGDRTMRTKVTTSRPTLSKKHFRRSVGDTARTKPFVGWFAFSVLQLDIVRHHKVCEHRLEFYCCKPPSRTMKQI